MDAKVIQDAIEALKAGRSVIFPTDTVCGLGVAPLFAKGPDEIFQLKRRSADKPVAWLIGSVDDLERYGARVSAEARELARRGWPGALTLVVAASAEVPRAFQSAQGTIGLRMPASETALALIHKVGPLATSSANRAGQPAPRALRDVDPELLAEAGAIVRTDEEGAGAASRVIDSTGWTPIVLRE